MSVKTVISIKGEQFYLNGEPTYKGRVWKDKKIEGLLLNTRMVQGIFDDLNPETRAQWAYPDTGIWDPDRNTSEFIEQMQNWRDHGVLGYTINLQGGSPYGYSKAQPWINSAFKADGSLRSEYMARLARILDAADRLGMVSIVGLFYFGQERELDDGNAIKRALDQATQWLLETGHENILIEVNNECDVHYKQPLLMPSGVHELIERAKSIRYDGRRILTGTSYGGGTIPGAAVVEVSDFILLHGNHQADPDIIRKAVQATRQISSYSPKPILFNEDDHFDFEKEDNNFRASIDEYASWGYFDYRFDGEGADDGYQSVPVNWGISSDRKRDFFNLCKEISGF